MTDPLQADDPLGEALHFLRVTGTFYCRSELTAPWGLAAPGWPDCMWFHIVTAGRFHLEVAGAGLAAQDVALPVRHEGEVSCLQHPWLGTGHLQVEPASSTSTAAATPSSATAGAVRAPR